MDASNYYNDPNRQNYPPHQQPQGYFPSYQAASPQQFNPAAQNFTYPGYHPNNFYAQQPQNPIPIPQRNKLDELDQGWFQCYKILLYIFIVFRIMGIIVMPLLSQQAPPAFILSSIIMEVLLIVFIVIQLQAIQKRDTKKAKVALTGFFMYLITYPTYIFGYFMGILEERVPVQYLLPWIGFIVCILFGSVQVYQFLKKYQSRSADGYQNMNNA